MVEQSWSPITWTVKLAELGVVCTSTRRLGNLAWPGQWAGFLLGWVPKKILSFFLYFRIPNLITGLSRWRPPKRFLFFSFPSPRTNMFLFLFSRKWCDKIKFCETYQKEDFVSVFYLESKSERLSVWQLELVTCFGHELAEIALDPTMSLCSSRRRGREAPGELAI